MKKYFGLVVLVIMAFFILSACGGGRDFSTPSSRLVGHWKVMYTTIEFYFSEIDEETGEGTFAMYNGEDDTLSKGTYVLVEETPEGKDVIIRPTFSGDTASGKFTLKVQKDGLKAVLEMEEMFSDDSVYGALEYIDDKTEYEPD